MRKERVSLTLRDNAGHSAEVELTPTDALQLASVLSGEMHGSSPDTWLVERLAGGERLWLTLSSTSRGLVRISRIEMDDVSADLLARSLNLAALECRPEPSEWQRLHRAMLRLLRSVLRWGVVHTRPLTRHHQLWMSHLHRSMLVLYRAAANVERTLSTRSH